MSLTRKKFGIGVIHNGLYMRIAQKYIQTMQSGESFLFSYEDSRVSRGKQFSLASRYIIFTIYTDNITFTFLMKSKHNTGMHANLSLASLRLRLRLSVRTLGDKPALITRLTLPTDSTKSPPLINYDNKQLHSSPRVLFRGTSRNLIQVSILSYQISDNLPFPDTEFSSNMILYEKRLQQLGTKFTKSPSKKKKKGKNLADQKKSNDVFY